MSEEKKISQPLSSVRDWLKLGVPYSGEMSWEVERKFFDPTAKERKRGWYRERDGRCSIDEELGNSKSIMFNGTQRVYEVYWSANISNKQQSEIHAEVTITPVSRLDARLRETFSVAFSHVSGQVFPTSRKPDPNKCVVSIFLPPLRKHSEPPKGTLKLRVNIDMNPLMLATPEAIQEQQGDHDVNPIKEEEEDVTIKLADGTEIKTRKAVLCAHSEVFTRMFDNKDSKESQEGVIHIDDAEPRALGQFVTYLSMGKLASNVMDQDLLDLLLLADKYMVGQLKEDSAQALTLKTDLDILPGVLIASFLCKCRGLYVASLRRAAEEFEVCRAAPEWKKLSENHQEITGDILSHMAELLQVARLGQLEK